MTCSHFSHYSPDLECTSVVGDKEVFKAQEGTSPCPKRTSRTVGTTLWPEDQAFFLLRSLGRALFPRSYWPRPEHEKSLSSHRQRWKIPKEEKDTKGGYAPCSGTLTLIKAALLVCQVYDLRIPDSSFMINTSARHLPAWLPVCFRTMNSSQLLMGLGLSKPWTRYTNH